MKVTAVLKAARGSGVKLTAVTLVTEKVYYNYSGMSEQYILSLDQGTSSSRAIVFDHDGEIKAVAQQEFRQIFPQPGWVEHHPQEIWTSQASVIAGAIASAGINGLDIAAIGITNQRETTIVWDRETGQPVYNAIVWQDRRTASYCDALKAEGKTEFIREDRIDHRRLFQCH